MPDPSGSPSPSPSEVVPTVINYVGTLDSSQWEYLAFGVGLVVLLLAVLAVGSFRR